ncbi:hypothetical protein [Rhizobium sp. AN68]|uniref:hypothetical protein n=1 Tax=Rhizobium sp. AN68 TaxID=3035122 RepID=UPI002B2596AA|nr:hypothetical protein [Rhizobium sp. AN68]
MGAQYEATAIRKSHFPYALTSRRLPDCRQRQSPAAIGSQVAVAYLVQDVCLLQLMWFERPFTQYDPFFGAGFRRLSYAATFSTTWLKSPTCDLFKCYYIGSNVICCILVIIC